MADNNFEFLDSGYTTPTVSSYYLFDFGGTAPYYSFEALPTPPEPPSPPTYNFNFDRTYTPPAAYDFLFDWTRYYLLKGSSNNFTAIWTAPDATISGGKIYVSSPAAFSVVNLNNNSIVDYYTTTHSGIRSEALQSNDVVDLYIQGA